MDAVLIVRFLSARGISSDLHHHMDFVQTVVSIAPAPYLSTAFKLLGILHSSVQQAQTSKTQLAILVQVTAGLLKALNERCLAGKLTHSTPSTLLVDLERCALILLRRPSIHVLVSLLDEINRFVAKILSQHFIKTVIRAQDTINKIDGFQKQIKGLVQAFEVCRIASWCFRV
jgi:hypothetical protein